MLLPPLKRSFFAGDHRLRRGNLSIKKGPADRKEPQKEGWYMQRLPKSGEPWMDIYFFFEKVAALTFGCQPFALVCPSRRSVYLLNMQ